jgi:hypothetical protein
MSPVPAQAVEGEAVSGAFSMVEPSLGLDPGGELRAAFENGDRC